MFEALPNEDSLKKADFERQALQLRQELLAQQRELPQRGHPTIIVIAGLDGAGKGPVIHRLNEWMDPRWLVTKAYGNSPPREFQEPFYRDHNNKDRLKPHLVTALANAELYCMAMSHLYTDPNYNNLNHWGIIQV